MMVIFLSRSFSIVRLAITPGTPHPVATRQGMKLFPERPNCLKIRSITNATRAMYPTSSRIERSRKRTNICGTKPITAPTPATIPSWISPYKTVPSSTWRIPRSVSKNPGTHSPKITSLVKSVALVPIETLQPPMAMAYTKNMIRAKIGRPKILLVTILSILSDTVSSPFARPFLTALSVTFVI